MKQENKLVGHVAIFIATLFFGLNIPALKSVMPEWFNGIDATFFRIGSATLLFWLVSLFMKPVKIEKKDWLSVLLCGMIGLFFFLLFFNLGVEYSSPIDISIIMPTPPVLVVLASILIFKKRPSKFKIIGVLLSLLGAFMIILIGHHGTGATRSVKGNLFGILSALSYAYYLIVMGKLSSKYPPVFLLRWVFLAATFVAIPVCLKSTLHAPILLYGTIKPWLILLFVMICPTFISYLLMPVAIKRIGHELVSMYQYLVPVIAAVVSILLGMDKLFWDQPIAAVVIIVGVIMASYGDKLEKK